ALVEDRLDGGDVEVRVERRARGARTAVHRPGVDVVGGVGEMRTGVDVVVAGGDDVVPGEVVPAARPDVRRHGCGHGGTPDDRQRPALAEVVLDVDHEQCPAHGASTEVSASARVMRTP